MISLERKGDHLQESHGRLDIGGLKSVDIFSWIARTRSELLENARQGHVQLVNSILAGHVEGWSRYRLACHQVKPRRPSSQPAQVMLQYTIQIREVVPPDYPMGAVQGRAFSFVAVSSSRILDFRMALLKMDTVIPDNRRVDIERIE